MKRLQRLMLVVLLLSLALSPTASAALQRGDSGDAVLLIQQCLHDGGFLSAIPDGVFGKQTEQAVIEFQVVFDYEPNGILDDTQIDYLLNGSEDLPDEFYTDGAGADGRGVESYCYSETRSDGYSYKTTTTYCDAHSWIVAPAEASLANGDAAAAASMYQDAVLELYNQLMTGDEVYSHVDTAFSAFFQMLDDHMAMLQAIYGKDDPELLQAKRAELLRSQMVFLCGLVNADKS